MGEEIISIGGDVAQDKVVGTWSNKSNQKTASGITQKTAPDTRVGILKQWSRQRAKFWCNHCQSMQAPESVSDIEQFSEYAAYTTTLACKCEPRAITVSVHRSESALEELKESKLRVMESRAEFELADQVPREVLEIRREMESEQLD
jgi:hypothetical protein